jgi:predicted nucleotidyltransferase
MRVICRYARAIGAEFRPDRIVLFGSHAYGTPHADSDVDLLVIMRARNQHDQAVRIRWRLAAPFPLDLIVRTPRQVSWRLKEGESFLTTIVSRGKVLYEKDRG